MKSLKDARSEVRRKKGRRNVVSEVEKHRTKDTIQKFLLALQE
jgi:hypothetical protein